MVRTIPGFPKYTIDDQGRIYGPNGKQKSSRVGGNGYLRVNVSTDAGKKVLEVHRAMAFAWVGPAPSPQHQVAHANGHHLDNSRANIVWKTPSENGLDRKRHGASFGRAKLRADEGTVLLMRRAGMSWGSISRQLKVPERSLRRAFGEAVAA